MGVRAPCGAGSALHADARSWSFANRAHPSSQQVVNEICRSSRWRDRYRALVRAIPHHCGRLEAAVRSAQSHCDPVVFLHDCPRNHYCGRQPPQKKTTAAHRRSRVPEPVARPRDHTFPRWTWRMRARLWRGDHSGGNRDHRGLLRGGAVTRTPALMFPSPFTIAMCYSARSPIG